MGSEVTPEIVTYGDPVLHAVTQPVTEFNEDLKNKIHEMYDIMLRADGVGLAANQIGLSERMFTYKNGNEVDHMINPVILDVENVIPSSEGCLSLPGMAFTVLRWEHVTIVGQHYDGSTVKVANDDLLAVIFQHEMDHLDGRLLLDRLDRKTRRKAIRSMKKMDG